MGAHHLSEYSIRYFFLSFNMRCDEAIMGLLCFPHAVVANERTCYMVVCVLRCFVWSIYTHKKKRHIVGSQSYYRMGRLRVPFLLPASVGKNDPSTRHTVGGLQGFLLSSGYNFSESAARHGTIGRCILPRQTIWTVDSNEVTPHRDANQTKPTCRYDIPR